MKFSLVRKALALAATLTLASCGGGGKATFPINVTVTNVLYPGLILSTNGMDVAVAPPATAGANVSFVFPNQIDYGTTYSVIPKGSDLSAATIVYGSQPQHQTCLPSTTYPTNFPNYGTAGQLASIQIYYDCSINAYALQGTVKGLTGTGLVIANGSSSSIAVSPVLDATTSLPTGADTTFALASVPYSLTYGVSVLTQPTGQTCTVTSGGANGQGVGTMDDTAEAAGGVTDLVVTCVTNPT